MGGLIDVKDKKILYELDSDSRQPISSIAKKVNLKKETVNYRIKRMQSMGLIKRYFTVIDTYKLGYYMCILYIRFQNLDLDQEKAFIKFLNNQKEVGGIIRMHGIYDIGIDIWVRDFREMQKVFDNINYNYGKYIQAKYISMANVLYPLKKRFLYNCFDSPGFVIGKDEAKIKLDKVDFKLLSLVSQSSRKSTAKLAAKLGLTANAVKHRLKRLAEKGVILGYRISASSKAMGYQHYKVFLLLQNITKDEKMRLIEFLRYDPNVNMVIDAVGKFDLEFEVDYPDIACLNKFLRLLRTDFGTIIRHLEVLVIYRKTETNYLPMFKFEEIDEKFESEKEKELSNLSD